MVENYLVTLLHDASPNVTVQEALYKVAKNTIGKPFSGQRVMLRGNEISEMGEVFSNLCRGIKHPTLSIGVNPRKTSSIAGIVVKDGTKPIKGFVSAIDLSNPIEPWTDFKRFKFKGDSIEKYRADILQKLEQPLRYDPVKDAPVEKVAKYDAKIEKFFKFKRSEVPVVKEVPHKSKEELLNTLEQEGKMEYYFTPQKQYTAATSKDAFIEGRDIGNCILGETVISDTAVRYGKGIHWSDEKISRDILQNFYDGHGHTLEGVRVKIVKNGGRYKIRISGDGLYAPERIYQTGNGSKNLGTTNPYDAGGFGEGSKVLTANLLYSGKTENVKFASADWEFTFAKSSNDIEKAMITKTLNQVRNPLNGNYIEFETTDKNFVDKIVEARDYFYHPENPDFRNLTFENKHWGFKLLNPKEKGNLYMTQRFEYNSAGNWNNELNGATIILKRRNKVEMPKFDTGRDRTSINADEIGLLIEKDFAKTMSDDELIDVMKKLEPVWNNAHPQAIHSSSNDAIYKLYSSLAKECHDRHIGFEFEDKMLLADDLIFDNEFKETLKAKGYTLCDYNMRDLGMKEAEYIKKLMHTHQPTALTSVQKKKMQLLEEGIDLLMKEDLIKKKLQVTDITQPRFAFNSIEQGYEELLGQAIIKNGRYMSDPKSYMGHWVSQKHLNEASYSELLATWLHEMTHQYGGDGTKEFTYALTDVLGGSLESVVKNPEIAQKLKVLDNIFNSLNKVDVQV